jgi:threonine synthase
MNLNRFPADIRDRLLPEPGGEYVYRCLACGREYDIASLLYTCPEPSCRSVLMIEDNRFSELSNTSGETWRRIFDYRKMLTRPAVKGVFRYHELLGRVIPLENVVYLGEGHTPVVEAAPPLQETAGMRFFFKNDGQNPSASFKDRGMAAAFSYIRHLLAAGCLKEVLAVCASTGDTSAAAALYAAYLSPAVASAVLLPRGKVTPQQLSQPLGSGAAVFEIPGVFDDCMKVVEALADDYNVALLNSKNAWRILGQESYAYEIAQDFEYETENLVIVVPVGNAGNITAVMSGFLKLFSLSIIDALPVILGVQSVHANPVSRYYAQEDPQKRTYTPVTVKASVAQAAMIGNPVSMPRVVSLTGAYDRAAGERRVFYIDVTEQEIMDWELAANRRGHIACTHGGECLAGLVSAKNRGVISASAVGVLDSTAHALKFAGFQDMYFENRFPPEYEIRPDESLINRPVLVHPEDLEAVPAPGAPLTEAAFARFVRRTAEEIGNALQLEKRSESTC